ncbi:hypothetical protein AN478_07180 [Thiohalorhabdus denitrificans]|uniref:Phosphate-selective porin O and P n=1 Tax=Thiohalorhabdus denitrificans TaxID=381306 RepID=A0A0P9CTH8_9GAMM|nr:porin [Thiohalorhabdus denitrificans]KPV39966.1 hypothetical protein AN478_07180 [Thiohalorhabdus denitrificans]SCY10046.1 Phosphate-selective porin O and P [Thiohalorhabdus denitrificans]
MRRGNWVLGAALAAGISGFSYAPDTAAGATIDIDEDSRISIGAGVRTSFRMNEDAAPSGDAYSKDFQLDNMRLYVSGTVYPDLGLEFNTEFDPNTNDQVRVLDALAKYEPTDLLNFRAGRMLPPSDRSNLDGPYYLNTYDFPLVANRYPAIYAGRDDGAAVWGTVGEGAFKYQVGAFEGRQGGPDVDDNPMYAGRLTLNFLDPEPGYYNSSTYYGNKDILALGLVGMFEKDGAGTAGSPGDFTGWNVDGLFEKNLGAFGVFSLEGAYYSYDLDGATDSTVRTAGDSVRGLMSFLVGPELGPGQLQPHVRYQSFDYDGGGEDTRLEGGLNYIIDGHNAKLSAIAGVEEDAGGVEQNFFLLGWQLQV